MDLQQYVAAVDAFMPQITAAGVKVLSPWLLGEDDSEHARALLASYMNPPPGARILDAGSGTGELARLMHALRPDLIFTLLNPSALQLHMGPAHMDKLCAPFEAIPAPNESFEVVLFSQSIEHALDVPAVLREAARVLAPGGQVFIFGLRHVSGPREHMTKLVWSTPLTREEMMAAAWSAGLRCDMACEPAAVPMCVPGVLDAEQHAHIFGGVRPYIWKFRKDHGV